MDTSSYKPNSHTYKEERKETPVPEKKVQKVVNGKVRTKKNEVRKLTDIFIAEDTKNIKDYVFMDILVPVAKKAITDIVKDSIDMLFYGETGRGKKSSGGSTYVSYRSYSDSRDDRRPNKPASSNRFNYEDIIFESKREAEAVLDQMCDLIDVYNFVTVADLYDMCELTAPYTSNKYGWTNLRNAETVRVRDGYVIKLPRAVPID